MGKVAIVTKSSKATTLGKFLLPYILIQVESSEIRFINIIDLPLVNKIQLIACKNMA